MLFYAQDAKLSKSEKKELKQEENNEELQVLYKLLESRHFVVEAEQVYDNVGGIFNVMPSINFFAVESSYSIIQLLYSWLEWSR